MAPGRNRFPRSPLCYQVQQMELEQEKELVARAKKDPSAFRPLYDEYYRRVFGYILVRTASVADTEDITSEVFLKALKNIRRFEWRGMPFASWLYRIAGNEIANKFRSDGHRRLLKKELETLTGRQYEFDADELAAQEQKLERMEDLKLVGASLKKLPLVYQEVIALRYFEKKSVEETARIMGRRQGTVKSLLHRGLLRLRKSLEENQ
jgi:RNA polymerase sigma factor (sigma-70 family)